MPSQPENGRFDGRELKSSSAAEDDVGISQEAPKLGDRPGPTTPGSSGQIGAAPIHWGWWASGLIVSAGIWWLVARTLS